MGESNNTVTQLLIHNNMADGDKSPMEQTTSTISKVFKLLGIALDFIFYIAVIATYEGVYMTSGCLLSEDYLKMLPGAVDTDTSYECYGWTNADLSVRQGSNCDSAIWTVESCNGISASSARSAMCTCYTDAAASRDFDQSCLVDLTAGGAVVPQEYQYWAFSDLFNFVCGNPSWADYVADCDETMFEDANDKEQESCTIKNYQIGIFTLAVMVWTLSLAPIPGPLGEKAREKEIQSLTCGNSTGAKQDDGSWQSRLNTFMNELFGLVGFKLVFVALEQARDKGKLTGSSVQVTINLITVVTFFALAMFLLGIAQFAVHKLGKSDWKPKIEKAAWVTFATTRAIFFVVMFVQLAILLTTNEISIFDIMFTLGGWKLGFVKGSIACSVLRFCLAIFKAALFIKNR